MKQSELKREAKMVLSEIIVKFMRDGWQDQFAEHLGAWGSNRVACDNIPEKDWIRFQEEMERQCYMLLKTLYRGK